MASKFIKLLSLFLLPLVIVFLLSEYCLDKVETTYSIKRKALDGKAASMQLLFMGNSHAMDALDPAVFNEPSLNLAHPAQPLYYDNKIILQYLPRLQQLKVVVLPIDYLSLFFDVEDIPLRSYYYDRYWGIEDGLHKKTDIKKYSLFALLGPSTCMDIFRSMIKERKINIPFQTNGLNGNGFLPRKIPSDTSGFELEAQTRMRRWNNSLMSPAYFSNNKKLVESLILTLKSKNIRVLLITTPVSPNIYLKYDSVYVGKRNEFIRYITKSYDNTVYADFTKDSRIKITDFADPNHLNSNGAKKFSTIIRDEYIFPMIHGKQ